MTVTFGGVFAVVLPPTRPTSLWAAIAVVRRPGVTFVVDAHCRQNALWLINTTAFRAMLTQPRTWGDPLLELPLK